MKKMVPIHEFNFLGNIIVIVNGKVLLDKVVSFFRNSYKVKPMSLQGEVFYPFCLFVTSTVCLYRYWLDFVWEGRAEANVVLQLNEDY